MEWIQYYLGNQPHFAWWVLAGVMIGIEVLMPTAWLLWPAMAGFAVGVIVAFFPNLLGWEEQIFLFIPLAFVMTWAGRRYFALRPLTSDKPTLNNRAAQLLGRKGQTLDDSNDAGNRIRLDDTIWLVRAADGQTLSKGLIVEVTGANDTILDVKQVVG